MSDDFGGWGSNDGIASTGSTTTNAAVVADDDDFGGWSSAAPATPAAPSNAQAQGGKGFGGSDDLFGNVWG